jgi:hypothetical protein
LACVKGLVPYNIDALDNGSPRAICASSLTGISLTTIYPGLMAFDTASHREKWGIIEFDVAQLHPEVFLPHEGFLVEKAKSKLTEEDRLKKLSQLRVSLNSHRRKWRDSIEEYGICVYEAAIPALAINRVTIYDPSSNAAMTKVIVNTMLGTRIHRSNMHRNKMVSRWLMGDHITTEEWVGSAVYSRMTHSDKDKIAQVLQNKHGLDIFCNNPMNGKKLTSSWW